MKNIINFVYSGKVYFSNYKIREVFYEKNVMVSIALFFVLMLNAQMKILVDNIHGADFIGDSGGSDRSVIDFYSLFPDDELTILMPDSLPFDVILIEENLSGMSEKNYTIDLPDGIYPEHPICLYAYAKCNSEDFWERADGFIRNPDGEIVAEFFQGSAHVEDAAGEGWKIELILNADHDYDVKIGYGQALFKSSAVEGRYDLSDWDLIVRIMDNCYYAIVGNPPLYDGYDLIALDEAFSGGMSFIFTDHVYDSMMDKPFIHFYSDENIDADVTIKFPGFYTLLSEGSKTSADKKGQIYSAKWEKHNIAIGSDNELIYEGALKEKLNFLHFDINGSNVTAKNLIAYPLNDLFLIKYHSPGIYRFSDPVHTEPLTETEITDWQYLSAGDVVSNIKSVFFKRGLSEGLTEDEIDDLVNNFHWVESLLYRARINKDDYFGFYHFGKDVYDRLVGFECEPYPEKLNRTMWVMLSFINNRPSESVFDLNMDSSKGEVFKGLTINEYGVTDEYYLPRYYQTESELFGISRAGWIYYWMSNRLDFYDSEFAEHFSNGWTGLNIPYGSFAYNYEQYADFGILYEEEHPSYPAAYGRTINDNGQLVVVGTSYFFKHDNSSGNTFLRTAADALVNGRILTGIEREDNLITSYNLTAYPNPFNPSTVIKFQLEKESLIELLIYNWGFGSKKEGRSVEMTH